MNAAKERLLDTFTYKIKIFAELLIIILDILASVFTQFLNFQSEAITKDEDISPLISGYKRNKKMLCFGALCLQIGLLLIFLFVFLSVVAQTYAFKHGLVKDIVKIKPVIFAFLFFMLYLIFLIIERMVRGKYLPTLPSNTWRTEIAYDQGWISILLLVLRYLFACLCYVWTINAIFELGKSRHYRRMLY